LTAAKIPGRISDWQALLQHVYQRERINGGVRCLFEGSVPPDELLRLVTAEQTCCEFFSFAITVDARGLALEVRASDEASSIVASLFGSAS
jgi:MerR family transcriptional regulator, copper efflux regulator